MSVRIEPVQARSHPATIEHRLVLASAACAIAVDQLTKAVAAHPVVNKGGTGHLLPDAVRALWAHPHVGAVLDLLDVVPLAIMLTLALRATSRRRRFAWTLLFAGWASNWADRIGLSALTQPGSPRGAVDWLRLSGVPGVYNGADLLILTGGLLLVGLTLGELRRRHPQVVATVCLCLLAVWVGLWSGDRRAVEAAAVAGELQRPAVALELQRAVLAQAAERARHAVEVEQVRVARAALAAYLAGDDSATALLAPAQHFACRDRSAGQCVVVVSTMGSGTELVYPLRVPRWARAQGLPLGVCDVVAAQAGCEQAALTPPATGALP